MSQMRKITSLLILGASLAGLSACSGAKEKLGLVKDAPDEFAVIRRAPLVVPPELARLPVPQPGAPRPQEKSAQELAAEAVFGENVPQSVEDDIAENNLFADVPRDNVNSASQPTAAESALIEAAGAQSASSDIRQVVNEENEDTAYEEQAVIDKIFDRKIEAEGSVLNPTEEAARIRQQVPEARVIVPGEMSAPETAE
tara:strand:+ start:808794 stop:809390 length:597 start_codon:yes stop_codon:yes gene_type:complete